MYALKIKKFSSKKISGIFEKHFDKITRITTDLWKGYRPLGKDHTITHIANGNGLNFSALHTMMHQVKSWIRTIYSWVSDFNINRYCDTKLYK